jgi:hypothetical protein
VTIVVSADDGVDRFIVPDPFLSPLHPPVVSIVNAASANGAPIEKGERTSTSVLRKGDADRGNASCRGTIDG